MRDAGPPVVWEFAEKRSSQEPGWRKTQWLAPPDRRGRPVNAIRLIAPGDSWWRDIRTSFFSAHQSHGCRRNVEHYLPPYFKNKKQIQPRRIYAVNTAGGTKVMLNWSSWIAQNRRFSSGIWLEMFYRLQNLPVRIAYFK